MKETVLDVLMYLFDNYSEEPGDLDAEYDGLRADLMQAGFEDRQVTRAFAWLEELAGQSAAGLQDVTGPGSAFRVFSEAEAGRLDAECRGFMLHLEHAGMLNTNDREVIMDRVMALEMEEIDLAQLKWIILMVLFNRPGSEAEFNWKEGFVMDDIRLGLH